MVEALSGPDLAALEQRGVSAAEIVSTFGKRQLKTGHMAQAALGTKWDAAYAKIADFNLDCPLQDDPAGCILAYLAAYEYDTALLKYVCLNESDSQEFDAHYAAIAGKFKESLESTNEYYTIAQRLALQLGQHRIFPVDAHAEQIPLLAMMTADPSIEKYIERLFGDVSEHPFLKEMNRRQAAGIESGDLLEYYRWQNSQESMQADVAFQWTPFIERDDETQFGKTRLALWEMRNFLMAANMARVMAEFPGETVLYIVGSGHKPFLDDYFRTTSWVEVLDAESVLGPQASRRSSPQAEQPSLRR